MEQIYLALALMGFLGCVLLVWRHLRVRKRLQRLTDQIEHFILYPQEPLEESLSEGSAANLCNRVARLEQMLLLQQKAAGRQERQMTRFVENMAHQMKNACTALQIQLDLLELHASEDSRSALQKSQICMKRLTDEIDKILKSSQLAEGKIRMAFEPVDLREELSACRERLLPIAGARNVSVEIAGAERLFLSADPFWLPQALENVMKNAVEHTALHSTVTVGLFDEGQKVHVLIEDEGKGIPQEHLVTLFERFHRVEETKVGYGIGLSMAKDIIAAHHGTVCARNRQAGGALFEIILPILDGARAYTTDQ